MVDFEKAFDSVPWQFIQETLNYFSFGPSFYKLIKTFQYNSNSCVTPAGFLSNLLKLGCGCRQSDNISPYIFLLDREKNILITNYAKKLN